MSREWDNNEYNAGKADGMHKVIIGVRKILMDSGEDMRFLLMEYLGEQYDELKSIPEEVAG